MSGRYFTNTKTFVGQDLNDLAKARTFQPNEFWIVWPEWTKKHPSDMPGDEWSEEGWREATEEEFWKLDADPDTVMHVIFTTQSEKDYKPGETLAETFGLQEAE